MRKLLALALLLGTIQLVAGSAFAIVVFRDVDLRFQNLLRLALIPLVQAFVLLWIARDPALRVLGSLPRTLRHWSTWAILATDAAVLAYALHAGVRPIVFAAHALVAATATIVAIVRVRDRRIAVTLGIVAAGLLLYAATGVRDWLALLPELLGRPARVLRWIAVYVPLFVVTLLILLRAAFVVEQRSRPAAGWIELSVALLGTAAIIVGGNIFFRPFLVEPWATAQAVVAYSSVTALLAGSVTLLRGEADAR